MSNFFFPLLAAAALSQEAPADAAFETVDPEYQACVAGLEADPEAVRQRTEKWLAAGGGVAALHCQAIGDLAAGYAGLAAVRLEELAAMPAAGDALVRARIMSQSALAWLEADKPEHAETAIEKAFAFAPEGGELYLPAAQVWLATEQYQATIDAVKTAAEEGYSSPAAYVASARAKMALLNDRGAAEDVIAALKLDPFNVDALTARGDLFQRGVAIDANYARPQQ
ncbi:MAG: hypothetical protein RIA10_05525 [Amphiplicatus sp.]